MSWPLLYVLGGFGLGCLAMRMFRGGDRTARADTLNPASPVSHPPRIPGVFLESCGEGVLILDAKDRIAVFNRAAAEAFRLSDETRGSDAAVVVRSADFIRTLREIREGSKPPRPESPVEITVRRGPREPEAVFRLTGALLPDDTGFGAGALALVFSDITKLRRLEAMRGEFVANVSHDLRTPVTIIKGYVRTLEEDFDSMDAEDRRRFLEKTRRATDRLHTLLESLLELANSESGATAEPVFGVLNRAVTEAVEAMSERLAERNLVAETLLSADDSRVALDPVAMQRVLQNLLENACRYATGASRVRLLSRAKESGGVELRVEDDGPCVVAADHEKLFRRFYRAEKSRSLAHGGAGLGLSIVKSLVMAQGGEVRAEPAAPRGLAIVMTFPGPGEGSRAEA